MTYSPKRRSAAPVTPRAQMANREMVFSAPRALPSVNRQSAGGPCNHLVLILVIVPEVNSRSRIY